MAETSAPGTSDEPKPAPRSPWRMAWIMNLWRFRLRTLFLAVALIGIFFAWWRDHRAQRGEIDRLTLELRALAQALQLASPAELKIREDLNKPTEFSFTETPLKDVVQFLSDLHGITILIDHKALEKAKVNPEDTLVTRSVRGVTLKSALNLILSQAAVTYIIENEVLIITSFEVAEQESMPRVHDATEWAKEGDGTALVKALELVLRPANKREDVKGGAVSPPRVQVVRGRVIVRGSEPEHQRVADLLKQLRQPRTDDVKPAEKKPLDKSEGNG